MANRIESPSGLRERVLPSVSTSPETTQLTEPGRARGVVAKLPERGRRGPRVGARIGRVAAVGGLTAGAILAAWQADRAGMINILPDNPSNPPQERLPEPGVPLVPAQAAQVVEASPLPEPSPTLIAPTQAIAEEETSTQDTSPEPAEKQAIQEDAYIPEELGKVIYAEKLGAGEMSFTIHDNTAFDLTANPDGPILGTELGRAFYFGQLLAPVFGFDDPDPFQNAEDYFAALREGNVEPVTLPQLVNQEGPLSIAPGQLSIVFERIPPESPAQMRAAGWIRNQLQGVDGQPAAWIRYEVADSGRVVIQMAYNGTNYERSSYESYPAILGFDFAELMADATLWWMLSVRNDGQAPNSYIDASTNPNISLRGSALSITLPDVYKWDDPQLVGNIGYDFPTDASHLQNLP